MTECSGIPTTSLTKLISVLLLASALTLIPFVGSLSSAPTATRISMDGLKPHDFPPEHHILSCGLDSIVLELRVPAVSLRDIAIGDTLFRIAQIPGESWLHDTGKPMVPKVDLLLATPEFDQLEIRHALGEYTELSDCLLYPCPGDENVEQPEHPHSTEEPWFDEGAYKV